MMTEGRNKVTLHVYVPAISMQMKMHKKAVRKLITSFTRQTIQLNPQEKGPRVRPENTVIIEVFIIAFHFTHPI